MQQTAHKIKPLTGDEEIKILEDVLFYSRLAKNLALLSETEWINGEKIFFIRETNSLTIFAQLKLNRDVQIGNLKKFGFAKDKTDDPRGWYIIPEGHPKLKQNLLSTDQLRDLAQKLHRSRRISENVKTKERYEFQTADEIKQTIKDMGLRPRIVIGQLLKKHYLVPMPTKPGSPEAYLVFKTQAEGKAYCQKNGRM